MTISKIIVNAQNKAYTLNGDALKIDMAYTTKSGNAPLSFNGFSGPLQSLVQYGKCSQASTPSPSSPVDIKCNNGVIKLSPNLLDTSADNVTLGKYIVKATGVVASSSTNFMCDAYIPVVAGESYVGYGRQIDGGTLAQYFRVAWYDSSKNWLSGGDYTQNTVTVNVAPANAAYARISVNPSGLGAAVGTPVTQEEIDSYYWVFQVGMEEPSEVHPYGEIYADGTAEVLTLGQQTAAAVNLLQAGTYKDEQDIVTGVVTRRLGIKVLTGSEQWSVPMTGKFSVIDALANDFNNMPVYCSHYKSVIAARTADVGSNQIGHFASGTEGSSSGRFIICDERFTASADFVAFLRSQYAAGTPVLIVYPLKTEGSEQVTPQPLSVIAGQNTVSVTAEVSPIDLMVEYLTQA